MKVFSMFDKLTVISGQTGSGKTEALLDIAISFSLQGRHTLFFSFEEPRFSIYSKIQQKIDRMMLSSDFKKRPIFLINAFNVNVVENESPQEFVFQKIKEFGQRYVLMFDGSEVSNLFNDDVMKELSSKHRMYCTVPMIVQGYESEKEKIENKKEKQ